MDGVRDYVILLRLNCCHGQLNNNWTASKKKSPIQKVCVYQYRELGLNVLKHSYYNSQGKSRDHLL